MKNIKKTILFLTVALVLATPVIGMLSPFMGQANADPAAGSPAASDTIENQVKSYIYLKSIAHCIKSSDLADYVAVGVVNKYHEYRRVQANNASDFKWFRTGSIKLSESTNTWPGYLDDDNGDGTAACGDSAMLQDAFSIWNLGGDGSNGIAAICNAGFVRTGHDGQSVDDCIKGTDSTFVRSNGDGGAVAKKFIAAVLKQYYGDTKLPTLSDPMAWLFGYLSVKNLCHATPTGIDASTYSAQQLADPKLVEMIGQDGQTKEVWQLGDGYSKDSPNVIIGTDNGLDDTLYSTCGRLATMAFNHAADYAAAVAANPSLGGLDLDGTSLDTDNSIGIDSDCGGISLSTLTPGGFVKSSIDWLTCAMAGTLSAAASGMDDFIATQLCVNETEIFSGSTATCSDDDSASGTADGFYTAWNTFRILAMAMLLIAGLIMIISQALGFEVFDAYTIKKTLPRILIAGIAISLSWKLLEFCVTISNALGIGVRALIYAPFIHANIGSVQFDPTQMTAGVLLGAVGLVSFGALGLLSFVATAALAILVAFLVIVIRNILVILLIIFAPVAIACYILPNTEKYFKIWWEWLSKALLMFPLITAFIAVGHVFAAISSARGGTINSFVALAAYVAPYFLIPLTFRLAGGAIATIGGIANDRSRGGFDRLKKFRGNRAAYNMQRLSDGERFNNGALNTLTSRATTRRLGFGRIGQAAYEQKTSVAAARHAKSDQGQAGQHNDGMLRAQTYTSETQARASMEADWGMSEHEINESIAAARANGGFGANRQIYAAKQLAVTGTGYNNLQQVAETVARVSGGSEGVIADVAGNINSVTKSQGRHGLAPGYGELVALSQGAANGTTNLADYHAATVAAVRGVDVVSQLRDKPNDVANATNALGDHARAQHLRMQNAVTQGERDAATAEFLDTMGLIDQYDQSKSYGSADVQGHVNGLVNDTADLRAEIGGMIGMPTNAGGAPILGPPTQQQTQNRQRWAQARAPRINPNDPNNPGP